MKKFLGYITLMRPANIITAWSNILVGAAIAWGTFQNINLPILNFTEIFGIDLLLLIIATSGLYGGGIVLNDYFDAKLDTTERPERPIPNGTILEKEALYFSIALYFIGAISAFLVNIQAGIVALIIVILTITYNRFAKQNAFLGPLNMGLCRAFNWLLGMSILGTFFSIYLIWAAIPLIYIYAITYTSRAEVHGDTGNNLYVGLGLYIFVILAIAISALSKDAKMGIIIFFMLIPSIVFYFHIVLKPVLLAINGNGKPELIQKSVKSAVIGVILVDASVAIIYQGFVYGILILLLLPISKYISRKFAVT